MSGHPPISTEIVFGTSDRDQLVKLTAIMQRLVDVTGGLTEELGSLKDTRIVELVSSDGILKEKVGRLEKVVYGLVAAVGLEFFALIFTLAKKGLGQ